MERHLLPDEIDQLIDGETGFGLAPLRAHLRDCEECREEVEMARALADQLDLLPHFAPRPAFTDRVMSEVTVFVPWHVALTDWARGLVPQSRPARVLAAVGGLSFASVASLAILWIVTRVDVLAFLTGTALERSRETSQAAIGRFLGQLLGASGPVDAGMLALVGGAVVLSLGLGTVGLRAVAAAGRRNG